MPLFLFLVSMPAAFHVLTHVSCFKFLGLAYAELKVNFVEGFAVLCLPVLSRPLSEVEGKSKYGVSKFQIVYGCLILAFSLQACQPFFVYGCLKWFC